MYKFKVLCTYVVLHGCRMWTVTKTVITYFSKSVGGIFYDVKITKTQGYVLTNLTVFFFQSQYIKATFCSRLRLEYTKHIVR